MTVMSGQMNLHVHLSPIYPVGAQPPGWRETIPGRMLKSARDGHFTDRMAEMNLADDNRTVAQIAHIVHYEIGPIRPALVGELFKTLRITGSWNWIK
jgi:hypothetical protein